MLVCVADGLASSGGLDVQSAILGERVVSPGRDYGAVVPLRSLLPCSAAHGNVNLRPALGRQHPWLNCNCGKLQVGVAKLK